ncbi:MAG: hypothetical protein O7E52_27405 [Candidatus Poribacteria bacterium]|nr:hypothetical protein [Candidatus Poribacteria bacterium]
MSKRKLSAEIRVADGAGGLRPVIDQRFEAGPWFAEQVIPAAKAKDWMAHVKAEMEERGWNSSGISQIEADENSGSISIRSVNSSSSPTLLLVWEKPRSGDLSVKARLGGTPQMSKELADSFMGAVRERLRTSATTVVHRWDMLTYEGLAWRGELWLGKNLRLGPPSRFPSSLLGPQVVIVDAMVEGIGRSGIDANFQSILREIQIFLGVVLGIRATLVRPENGWVAEFDDKNHPIDCQLQSVGYWEVGSARTFPVKGDCASVARESVTRPGTGGRTDQQERWVPEDIEELWLTFKRLPKEMNDNFLRAGNAFLIAQSMWPDQKTAYAAFHVVACEALKPIGKRHDRLNIYDVIASLVEPIAAMIRFTSILTCGCFLK